MARSSGAASLALAGIPLGDSSAMEASLRALAKEGVRAFLFPGALLGEPERLGALAEAAQAATKAAGLGRALVAIGGSSSPSFGQPFFPAILSSLGLAALASRQATKRSGRLLGSALAARGVDLVLAPSLDLAVDPKDLSGALDRFGEEPEAVGSLAAAFIRGLRAGGVEACVGRFPGLGSACLERGEGMASLDLPADRLASVEMRPFALAARAGAAAVFVGAALVPALEPDRIPASRSSRVIEGRLRQSLGFKGLVVGGEAPGDCDAAKAALLGALAGCDLGLLSEPERALAAARALEEAAADGALPAARVAVSRARLERFLSSRRPGRRLGAVAVASLVDPAERERIERDREAALSVLKGTLALPPGPSLVLAFVPPPGGPDAAETAPVAEALRAGLPEGAELVLLPADPSTADAQALADRLAPEGGGRAYAAAAALTYDAHFRPAQEGLARLVEESVPRFSVVAMRDPYDAAFFPRASGLAAAYGFTGGGAAAVARLLSGSLAPAGSCPVVVIGLEV